MNNNIAQAGYFCPVIINSKLDPGLPNLYFAFRCWQLSN